MKIRNGFVSNSSSSSFIIIGKKIKNHILPEGYIIGEYGETEFGWDPEKHYNIHSKINFAYLQALTNKEWMNMLYNMLKKHGVKNIMIGITEDYNKKTGRWAYIDHQSHASEGRNIEMFNDEESLERFLFSDDSYIQCDNDNH